MSGRYYHRGPTPDSFEIAININDNTKRVAVTYKLNCMLNILAEHTLL